MKKYFDHLRPAERRMVVGVGVILFIVLNWVYVWPEFGDWNNLNNRRDVASRKLVSYQAAIAQAPELQKQVQVYEKGGAAVPPEDQGINFIRVIQQQAVASGVQIVNTSRQTTHTNDAFFIEQVQNINVSATDEQLVDFLYKLGSDASMIRVRDLELQPDTTHMHLTANIQLVASYQKNSNPKPAPAAAAAKPATNPQPAPGPKPAALTPIKKPGLPPMRPSNAKAQ